MPDEPLELQKHIAELEAENATLQTKLEAAKSDLAVSEAARDKWKAGYEAHDRKHREQQETINRLKKRDLTPVTVPEGLKGSGTET